MTLLASATEIQLCIQDLVIVLEHAVQKECRSLQCRRKGRKNKEGGLKAVLC
jgi:hypothetical protein